MPDSKELKGPSTSLRQEERALSLALCELFDSLDVSLRRYAARMDESAGTVSRYLSGDRIPSWKFIHDLLTEVTIDKNGVPPTHAVVAHLKSLHMAALRVQSGPFYERMLLEHELRESDAHVQRLKRREIELSSNLQLAEQEIAQLRVHACEQDVRIDRLRIDYEAKLEVYRNEEHSRRQTLKSIVLCLMATSPK